MVLVKIYIQCHTIQFKTFRRASYKLIEKQLNKKLIDYYVSNDIVNLIHSSIRKSGEYYGEINIIPIDREYREVTNIKIITT
ncbi:MAG: hypothetical protein ACRC7S_05665 [Cetobacterium sp.]